MEDFVQLRREQRSAEQQLAADQQRTEELKRELTIVRHSWKQQLRGCFFIIADADLFVLCAQLPLQLKFLQSL